MKTEVKEIREENYKSEETFVFHSNFILDLPSYLPDFDIV